MMVVATSNYNQESYQETIYAKGLSKEAAETLAKELNLGMGESDTYYNVFDEDYEPWKGMEDLV